LDTQCILYLFGQISRILGPFPHSISSSVYSFCFPLFTFFCFDLCDRLWKCCKVFLCIVVTAERSVNELFMLYFYNLSPASPVFAHTSTGGTPSRWGTFVLRPLICPPLKKNLWAPMLQAVLWCGVWNMQPSSTIKGTIVRSRLCYMVTCLDTV